VMDSSVEEFHDGVFVAGCCVWNGAA
jgi:hypothetical protein